MKKLPNKVFFYDGITITDFANFKGLCKRNFACTRNNCLPRYKNIRTTPCESDGWEMG